MLRVKLSGNVQVPGSLAYFCERLILEEELPFEPPLTHVSERSFTQLLADDFRRLTLD
jgi:hypothetical protein